MSAELTCSEEIVSRPTLTNRLKGRIEKLEKELVQMKDVLSKLEENPGIQEVFDSVYKLGI